MKTNVVYNARDFMYSLAYQGPNETSTYLNDTSEFLVSHVYVVEGSIKVYESAAEIATDLESAVKTQLVENTLHDISQSRGKYITSKTDSIGAALAMFNAVPPSKKIKVEILKDKQTKVVDGTNNKVTIVCLTGPIKVNDIEMISTQFAAVEGKSVSLVMEENHICALVSEA